ncbi:MAG: intradiol ring-cleavage dioxygenase [Anaerolineae bacterium]|nr:intradiol ring-cleavage dioxygenase [Anaerolineae bacterium]
MDNDDQPIGRILTRREVLTLLGGAGAALFVGGSFIKVAAQSAGTSTPIATATAVPACVVRPALTEGPYFVDAMLNRSDIRVEPTDGSIKEGKVLRLIFNVSDVSADACTPLPGAQVDVWHCDAQGWYSDVDDPGFDTSGQSWLRGYQVTDDLGIAEFITIYPGWYSSRTVHIHFKIRTDPESESGYEFTSQLFFDEALTDLVHSEEPYASKGYRDTLNEDDNIFQGSDGLLTLAIEPFEDEALGLEGYAATFSIGLDLSQPAEEVSSGGGPGGNPPDGNRPGGTPPNGNPPGGRP